MLKSSARKKQSSPNRRDITNNCRQRQRNEYRIKVELGMVPKMGDPTIIRIRNPSMDPSGCLTWDSSLNLSRIRQKVPSMKLHTKTIGRQWKRDVLAFCTPIGITIAITMADSIIPTRTGRMGRGRGEMKEEKLAIVESVGREF